MDRRRGCGTSRATTDTPEIVPSDSLIGEIVSETWIERPSLVRLSVS